MNRKVRTTKTRAVALTSPAPARVSVCGAGANQTPFNAIKSEGLTLVEKKDLPPMIQSLKAQGFDVVSFAFKGDNWTMDAVTGWLNDGGYVGFKAEGADGDILVTSEAPAAWMADAEKREIATEDGVTVTVGKMPEDAATETVVEAAADAASEVQPVAEKAEGDSGLDANTTVVADKTVDPHSVLADGANPPVEAEPEAAASEEPAVTVDKAEADVVAAIAVLKQASALPEERRKGFYEIEQVADVIRSLKWLVNDATYEVFWADAEQVQDRVEVLNAIKNAGGWLLVAFARLVAVEVDGLYALFDTTPSVVKSDDTAEEPAAEPAEPVTADKSEDVIVTPEAPAAEAEPEDPVLKAVKQMLAPLTEGLAEVQKTVASLTAPDAGETAEKSAATPDEPVAAAPARQTRKSEDADAPVITGTPATKDEQAATDRVASLRLRGALGL